MRVLCVYSGALAARYNDEQQLFEWFPELRGKIDCAYFPEATHTFTELETQEGLLARVTDWLDTPAR